MSDGRTSGVNCTRFLGQVHSAGKRLCQRGFAHAGDILNQHMAAGQYRHHDFQHDFRLAQHRLAYLGCNGQRLFVDILHGSILSMSAPNQHTADHGGNQQASRPQGVVFQPNHPVGVRAARVFAAALVGQGE